jgi:hypothetical protein
MTPDQVLELLLMMEAIITEAVPPSPERTFVLAVIADRQREYTNRVSQPPPPAPRFAGNVPGGARIH